MSRKNQEHRPKLAQKEAELLALIRQMDRLQAQIQECNEEYEKLREEIFRKKRRLRTVSIVQQDINHIKILLARARSSVEAITAHDLIEIGKYNNPADRIKEALEALFYLLQGKSLNWESIRREIAKPDFITSVLNFQVLTCDPKFVDDVQKNFLSKDSWNVEKMYNASLAVGPLAEWLEAQILYFHGSAKLAPIQEELSCLQKERQTLSKKEAELQQKIQSLEDLAEATQREIDDINSQIEELQVKSNSTLKNNFAIENAPHVDDNSAGDQFKPSIAEKRAIMDFPIISQENSISPNTLKAFSLEKKRSLFKFLILDSKQFKNSLLHYPGTEDDKAQQVDLIGLNKTDKAIQCDMLQNDPRLLHILSDPTFAPFITSMNYENEETPLYDHVYSILKKIIEERDSQQGPPTKTKENKFLEKHVNDNLGSDLMKAPEHKASRRSVNFRLSIGVMTDPAVEINERQETPQYSKDRNGEGGGLNTSQQFRTLKKAVSKDDIDNGDKNQIKSTQHFLETLAYKINKNGSLTDLKKGLSSERNVHGKDDLAKGRNKQTTILLRSASDEFDDPTSPEAALKKFQQTFDLLQIGNEDPVNLKSLTHQDTEEARHQEARRKTDDSAGLNYYINISKDNASENISSYTYRPPQKYNDFDVSGIDYSVASKSQISKMDPTLTNTLTALKPKKSINDSNQNITEDLLARIDKQLEESNIRLDQAKNSSNSVYARDGRERNVIEEAAEESERHISNFGEESIKNNQQLKTNKAADNQNDRMAPNWSKKMEARPPNAYAETSDQTNGDKNLNTLKATQGSNFENPFRYDTFSENTSNLIGKEASRKTLNFQNRAKESVQPESGNLNDKPDKSIPLPERETLRSAIRINSGRSTTPTHQSIQNGQHPLPQIRPSHSPDCMVYREVKWQNHSVTLSTASNYQTHQNRNISPGVPLQFFASALNLTSNSDPQYSKLTSSNVFERVGLTQNETPSSHRLELRTPKDGHINFHPLKTQNDWAFPSPAPPGPHFFPEGSTKPRLERSSSRGKNLYYAKATGSRPFTGMQKF